MQSIIYIVVVVASPFAYCLELNEPFPETSLRASLWKIVPNILTRIGNQSGILYVIDRYKQIREN